MDFRNMQLSMKILTIIFPLMTIIVIGFGIKAIVDKIKERQ